MTMKVSLRDGPDGVPVVDLDAELFEDIQNELYVSKVWIEFSTMWKRQFIAFSIVKGKKSGNFISFFFKNTHSKGLWKLFV